MHPKVAIHTEAGVIVRTDMDNGMYPEDGHPIDNDRLVHRIWDLEGLSEMEFMNTRVWDEDYQMFIEVPPKPNVYATWEYGEWAWDIEHIVNEIRFVRNQKITETDWMLVVDSPFIEEERQIIMSYRQELRDITETLDMSIVGSLDDVVWPTLDI